MAKSQRRSCTLAERNPRFEEFGQLTDTYGDTYREHYGIWRWQDYSDPRARFATRDDWYARHVK